MANFYKILFLNTMILGTMISIASSSWLVAWIGLEVNLLSLMPLMKNFKNKYSSEATIKYFIVQAMSSALLLFSIIIFTNTKNFMTEFTPTASLLINSALLLKLGAAPFHFWMPEVLSGLNWEMTYILMTWQKIAPMILLSYSMNNMMFLSIIIVTSSIIGGMQGLNQTCMRKIMAYSSINHVGWMISAMMCSTSIWMYYFFIYCIINLNIILILNAYNILFLKQINKMFSFNKKIKFFFMSNFLSLSGLPPFLGFLPKWLTVNHMINNNFITTTTLLIIFTLISIYFYLRITFTSFSLSNEESMMDNFYTKNYYHFFINILSLMGLLLCASMMSFN